MWWTHRKWASYIQLFIIIIISVFHLSSIKRMWQMLQSRRGFWDIEPFASPAVSQTRSQWLCTLFAVFRITAQQLRISTMSIITLFIIASFWSVNLAKLRSWSRKREVQTQSPDCGTIESLFSSTEHFTVRRTLTADRVEGSTLTENTESWRKCVTNLKNAFLK